MANDWINLPVGGAKTWKNPVPTVADLPTNGNNDGDVRATLDTHSIYIWDEGSTSWLLVSSGTGGLNSITGTAPVVISGTVTDPIISVTSDTNTFAGFDNSGNLESVPGFAIDTTSGGMNESLIETPNNVGGGFSANSFNVAFQPIQDSPTDDWNIQAIAVNFDSADSGFSQGTDGEAATLLNMNANHGATGPIGQVNQIKTYFSMGNGTDPLTIKGTAVIFGFADYNDNLTIDGALQGYTFQPHVHSGAISTGNFNISAFSDNSNIEIAVHGYNGYSSSQNLLEITNNSNYNAFTCNPTIGTLTGNSGAYGYGFFPTITTIGATGQVVGLNMNPTITTLGTNANYQGVTIGGSITTMGSSSNVNGYSWFPNITTSHGNLQGLNINPTITGGDASFVGLNVAPQGGATLSNVTGLQINLSQVNTSEVQGPTGISSDSRLQINATTQLKASQGFQIGSRIEHAFTVPDGSPVTGTDELGVNVAGDFIVQDDVSTGPIGIGFNSVGFIASIGVAATKTVDTITVFLPAASTPDPGFATGGNVTNFHMIRTFPPLAQGGTLNITNLYGFKLDSIFGDFGAAATNAWGIYIDAPTAENYIGSSIAIGTASKKVSNNSIALEVESTTKAIRFPNMTTTQKLALVPLSGMQVFDTTLNQMSYFNGTSWINF